MGEIIAGILCVAFGIFMIPYIVHACKYAADEIGPLIAEFIQSYRDAWKEAISIVFKEAK